MDQTSKKSVCTYNFYFTFFVKHKQVDFNCTFDQCILLKNNQYVLLPFLALYCYMGLFVKESKGVEVGEDREGGSIEKGGGVGGEGEG